VSNKNEIEVKFLLKNFQGYQFRLGELGVPLWQPRVLEVNLRFDTPDGRLRRDKQVLRLRQDYTTYFTFKDAAQPGQSVSIRQEIEVDVNDFATARIFLESLGFQVEVSYEKYRTAYKMDDVLITLDEMPFGFFTELEGPDAATIEATAKKLGLDWNERSMESYIGLFEKVKQKRGLRAQNLTFEEFKGVNITPADLGLMPAD
jgi:adenylate cyclase, class 2